MSRRIIVETQCSHGWFESHWLTESKRHGSGSGLSSGSSSQCPGGSRTVLDGIPEEWVARVASVLHDYRYGDVEPTSLLLQARAVLESVLGDG